MRKLFLTLLFFPLLINAQVAVNDNCQDALEISIANRGFAIDTFKSAKCDVSNSGREIGEMCSKELEDVGNCDKTVWYKFYIPTTRSVGVRLMQEDSAIPQIFSGFNVYKVGDCNFSVSDLSKQLQPVSNFSTSGNNCLSQGWYLIQVGCKKKAKGELWIQLVLNEPLSDSYDHVAQCFDISSKSWTSTYSQFLNVTCASVTAQESLKIADSSYSKSIWVSLNLFSSYNNQSLDIYANAFKFRIFVNDANNDSLLSDKPFLEGMYFRSALKEICSNTANQKIFLQIAVKTSVTYVYLSVIQANLSVDPWNEPAKAEVLQIKANEEQRRDHSFGCASEMEQHACKTAIPEYYAKTYVNAFYPYQKFNDTFRYAGYKVIDVTEQGVLEVYIKDILYSPLGFMLFEGDVTKNCQLKAVRDSVLWGYTKFRACVNKGIYTLLILDKEIRFKTYPIVFNLNVADYPLNYAYPALPQNLGAYQGALINSDTIAFRQTDTSLSIANYSFKGRFIFREIDIPQDTELKISTALNGYVMVLSGSIRDGNSQPLTGIKYSKLVRTAVYSVQESPEYKRCFYLKKGHYSIVSYLPHNDYALVSSLSCDHLANVLLIEPNKSCQALNTEAVDATEMNSMNDVFSNPLYRKDSLNYSYQLNTCNSCASYTNVKPMLSTLRKSAVGEYTLYSFYTFRLREDASLRLNTSRFELYRGNVKIDPSVIQDTANIVSPCASGNIICNLRGGVYTLVLIDQNSDYIYTALFSKHRKTINDYFVSAYDLGQVGAKKTSKGEYITCHTSSLENDPRYFYSYNQADKKVLPVKWKDSSDYRRFNYNNRNIWYTFTVSGNSEVEFEVENNSFSYSLQCVVYRYKGGYEQNFADLLANGIDSSTNNFEVVYVGNQYKSSGKFRFNNEGCRNNRYFVVIDRMPAYIAFESPGAKYYRVSVNSTPLNTQVKGDLCSNPEVLETSLAGTYRIVSDNTCHTYGASPFEEEAIEGVKSTWYKIVVNDLQRFEIGVKNINSKGLMRFALYGGYCGGMTPIAKGEDKYSFFSVSCMREGVYYLQAISAKQVLENLEFEITLTEDIQSRCSPYDFNKPIAGFSIQGGCQSTDTLQLINRSSSGSDMGYKWFLNDVLFAVSRNAVLDRNQANILAVNTIKLVAENTRLGYTDTFESVYRKDNQVYDFYISALNGITCDDTFRVSVNTNYPYKINYTWTNSQGQVISEKNQWEGVTGGKIFVRGLSDNCEFQDEFELKFRASNNWFGDTIVCRQDQYSIVNSSVLNWSVRSDEKVSFIKPGESLELESDGDYVVSYFDGSCFYTDTFNFLRINAPTQVSTSSQLFSCTKDTIHLRYTRYPLTKIKWDNGETDPLRVVSDSGIYQMEASVGSCSEIRHIFKVVKSVDNYKPLKDTSVCRNSLVSLKNPIPGSTVLSQVPASSEVRALKGFDYALRLKIGTCVVSDTATYSLINPLPPFRDTFVCDQMKALNLILDPGSGADFNWYTMGVNTQTVKIVKYGHYPLYYTDANSCKDTLTFRVENSCDFAVYIPDGFSPNGDGINDEFIPVVSGANRGFEYRIFNRWGEMVYSGDQNSVWDGTLKSETVSQGVYSYLVTVFNVNGTAFVFKGTLSILR